VLTLDEESGDFETLTQKISDERGFRCASYKDKCLRRRIAVRMRARGVHTYADYSRILDDDGAEYDRLLDALTINVTKLFRNWEAYAAVADRVVPALWSREQPRIRVWSAGCSSGEEPYSIAVLFHRFVAESGAPGSIRRLDVLGTDIDRRCLARARTGDFGEGDFADTPEEIRARYFGAAPDYPVDFAVRQVVRFEQRDLLVDPAPAGPFDLIVCRNVMIYFDRDSQERLFEKFHGALAPDGFLMLGKVETLLGRARGRFAPVDARERIFKKL